MLRDVLGFRDTKATNVKDNQLINRKGQLF